MISQGHIIRPNKMKCGQNIADLINIITAKFGFNWPSSFRGDDQHVKCKRRWTQSDGNSSHDTLGQVSHDTLGQVT